jgi:putative tryptophan/tyrosine transport system substrate-binding protein
LLPQAKRFSVLINPANTVISDIVMKGVETSSRALGLELQILNADTGNDFEAVFAKLVQPRTAGVLITANPVFNSRAHELATLTLKHAVPAVHAVREFAMAGGLMSYGGNIRESHRQAGIYTGRILKGEKPANLPVQLATKVELYINLKTAKALGINVPNTLIGRADEVIE